jgi:hypothetical protein
MRNWWLLATFVALSACGGKKKGATSAEDIRAQRETKISLEKCDTASAGAEGLDANGDGRPDVVRVKQGAREVCRTTDLNFDGKIDRTTFFDAQQKVRRVESDFDRDGLVDELSLFEGGVLKEKHRATTMDGTLDTWEFYEKGKLARTERDEDGDGFIDHWWEYPRHGCPLIHVDTDGDGRPDPGASIDYCKETGFVPPPLPGEDEPVKKGADFGSSNERVEETENRAEEGAADGPSDEAAPTTDADTSGGKE